MSLESLRLGVAFSLGVATFFAPCAVPLLPGYVAYFLGRDGVEGPPSHGLGRRLGRAVGVAFVTSLGFLLVYVLLAAVVFALGSTVLGDVALLELGVGVVLIGVGAAMATGRRVAAPIHVRLPDRRRGPLGFFAFGVVYAVAAAGCTAALFVAVAGLAVAAGPLPGLAVVGAYAAGMAVLLLVVTVLTALGRGVVVRRLAAGGERLRRAAGVVLVIAGLVQLYYFVVVFRGLSSFGL
jgi:cytochrome c-type biogenesis protein